MRIGRFSIHRNIQLVVPFARWCAHQLPRRPLEGGLACSGIGCVLMALPNSLNAPVSVCRGRSRSVSAFTGGKEVRWCVWASLPSRASAASSSVSFQSSFIAWTRFGGYGALLRMWLKAASALRHGRSTRDDEVASGSFEGLVLCRFRLAAKTSDTS